MALRPVTRKSVSDQVFDQVLGEVVDGGLAAGEQLLDPERRRALAEAGLAYARSLTLDKVLDRLEAAFAAEGAPVL